MLVSPLSEAAADASDWYLAGSVAYFDNDPDRRLDASVGGGQFNVGYRLTDVF